MSNQPSKAIERARIAYEQMEQRQQDAEMQRRWRDRSRALKLVVLVVATLLLFGGTAVFWLPESVRSSIFGGTDDFSATRIGQVRSFVKGDICRELQFNNDRGGYVGGYLVSCEAALTREASPPSKGTRMHSIRDAFTR